MRIEFQRAGGIAAPAMKQSYSVDSDDLAADEAAELQDLVERSEVASLESLPRAARPIPDATYFRVIIEDGGGRHTITASDADMPSSLRPLIEWLSKRARPG